MIRETLLYGLARGGPAILNIAAISLYTRWLEPDEYGVYALVLSGAAFFNVVLFYWLRAGLARFYHATEEESDLFSTLGRAFVGMMGISVGAALTIYAVDASLPLATIGLGLTMVWAFAGFELALEVARSRLNPAAYGWLNLGKSGLAIGLSLSLIYFTDLGGLAPIVGTTIGMMSIVALGMFTERSRLTLKTWKPELARDIFTYAAPLAGIAALGFVLSSADRFMLAHFFTTGHAGRYSAGYDLAYFAINAIFTIVNLSAYPRVVKALDTKGEAAARVELVRNLEFLLLLGVPATAGLMVCSPNLAGTILGAEFAKDAAHFMPLVALGAFFAGIKSTYTDLSFHLGKKTWVQLFITANTAAINLVLNLLLLPAYGIMGAAFATLVSLLLALLQSAWFGRKVFRLPLTFKTPAKVLVATACMSAAIWPLRTFEGPVWLGLQIGAGVLIYGLFILAQRVPLKELGAKT
ncbi:lipopolysaccharide biosynthesis protein [Microvenator marinus]|uniref:Lipopolysaccharide biosynthesis protein n=1 Tax=Microvenator marinus TaxID=2600177 RepID=A0A5B8XT31_9DELT|nr:lipopolysaccharide biosynthesis protein [Microvenator marinus]QED28714.1 lipopolysaccharide biosynthesis protein [Microvenator marinus]